MGKPDSEGVFIFPSAAAVTIQPIEVKMITFTFFLTEDLHKGKINRDTDTAGGVFFLALANKTEAALKSLGTIFGVLSLMFRKEG